MAILINLNDARKKLNELEGSAEYNKGVTDAFNALFDLPAIAIEQKHGRWIKVDVGDCCYRCSECGFIRDGYLLDISNYCPKCGAKMEERK